MFYVGKSNIFKYGDDVMSYLYILFLVVVGILSGIVFCDTADYLIKARFMWNKAITLLVSGGLFCGVLVYIVRMLMER